ncbi:Carboxypeptidase B [Papilio machaon]|uniref:Carboxypeptidase B n=1 Tax=Papilio machaon TaxID=76193 RepID=A0A194RAV8_PAPMA|nr:Carboxypeptidase B [Papilio machaon]
MRSLSSSADYTSPLRGIIGLSPVGCGESNEKYDNYTLFRIYPTEESQFEIIKLLQTSNDSIEVLKKSRGYNDSTDVLVPPDRLQSFEDLAKENHFKYDLKSQYGRSFESPERAPRRRVLRGFNIYEYHSFAAIQEYIETMASKHPELIKLQTLGSSYQGRKMKLVKISQNPHAGNPIIFIDAGIHAREWVAPAMALYLIHRLVMDPEARKRDLRGVDWYVLPVVNPDGYEFTRSSKANRLWRKTRSKSPISNCYGVDGNRNYGYQWAVSGVSNNPCDMETYAGNKPFSEPETQMVRDVMLSNADRIKLYVSLHAYGQYLVYPWGYTAELLPKQWRKLDSLARKVSLAVQNSGGQPFKVMSAGQWYPAAGGSDDFAFGAAHVPYSYTMELTDGYEFVFPENRLRNTLPQLYEGFRAFASEIRNEFSNKRLRDHAS